MLSKIKTRIKNFIEEVKDYLYAVKGCFKIGWEENCEEES